MLYLLSILTTGLSAFYLFEGVTVGFFLLPFSIYLLLFLRVITQFGCEFLLLFPPTETCRIADCSEMEELLPAPPPPPPKKKNLLRSIIFQISRFFKQFSHFRLNGILMLDIN